MTTVEFQLGGTLKFIIDQPVTRAGCFVTLRYDGFTVTARGDNMAYKLPSDKMIQVQVAYVDAKGNPAMVDGDVVWDSSDENIAIVEADSGDSTIASVTPGDAIGQAQISATADADLGAGITQIITTMDIEVVSGQAVAGTITPVGEPQPI